MIGSQELILILAILLLVFGPTKLPEIAKELGRMILEFNKMSAHITDTVSSTLNDEEDTRETLVKIAKNLGVNTEGKSTTQLVGEIERKMIKNEE